MEAHEFTRGSADEDVLRSRVLSEMEEASYVEAVRGSVDWAVEVTGKSYNTKHVRTFTGSFSEAAEVLLADNEELATILGEAVGESIYTGHVGVTMVGASYETYVEVKLADGSKAWLTCSHVSSGGSHLRAGCAHGRACYGMSCF